MPTGPCPECGHLVALSAVSCPQCGNRNFALSPGLTERYRCRACDATGRDSGNSCHYCQGTGYRESPVPLDARDLETAERERRRVTEYERTLPPPKPARVSPPVKPYEKKQWELDLEAREAAERSLPARRKRRRRFIIAVAASIYLAYLVYGYTTNILELHYSGTLADRFASFMKSLDSPEFKLIAPLGVAGIIVAVLLYKFPSLRP